MATADYITAVLADSPKGYWTLGDAGPTSAADETGNGHTATGTSITWEQDGPEDSLAAGLAAPNSYLTISDSADWVFTDVTLEAWVYPGAAGAGGRMSILRHQASSGPYLFLALVNLVPEVGSQPDGFIQTRGSALTADTWYHLAAVRDRTAGTWTVYLNGSQIGTTIAAAGGSNIDISANLMIGAWAGGTSNRYDGRIAHVAYYTTALSSARVAAHYAAMFASGTDVEGTAQGLGGGAGTSSGIRTRTGTASGAGGGTGTAAGVRIRAGAAAGTGGGTGTAVGEVVHDSPTGTAQGLGGGTATATGTRVRTGVAFGDGAGSGAAAGVRVRSGTATGAGGGLGHATGVVYTEVTGTAFGDGGGVGTAVGTTIRPSVAAFATYVVPSDPWVLDVGSDPWDLEVPADPWSVLIGAP